MKILITGSCGFIGFNLSCYLLKKGYSITGIDNLNNYYSVKIKLERLKILRKFRKFKFHKIDLKADKKLNNLFHNNKFNSVIHLAAQAGVRYSIDNPRKYIDSNINGFFNILEACKRHNIKKNLFASSSSVYGDSKSFPLSEKQEIKPKNLYGLTKKNNEEMAKIYCKFYNMNLIGLRFFTIYGEYGRPDMFMMKYLNAKKEFNLFNFGKHYRDFTYIEDVNKIITKLLTKKSKGFSVYNICGNKPVKITNVIEIIKKNINKEQVKIKKIKLQKADVIKTHGDNKKIIKKTGFKKFTSLEKGLENLIRWFKNN